MIAFQSRVEGFIHELSERIDSVEERVDAILDENGLEYTPQMLKGLTVDSSSSLTRLKRALFNIHNKMQCEENAIIEKIEALPHQQQDQFILSQQLRDAAATVQLYFEDTKHLIETNAAKQSTQARLDLSAECRVLSSELTAIFYDLPAAGSSLHEWVKYTPEEMKSFRPRGRPSTPAEVNIQRWRRDVSLLLSMIREVTGEPGMTLQQALPVEGIGPGRPRLSALGVMDRRLVALYIKQQKLTEKEESADTLKQLSEIALKIEDLKNKISETESNLPLTDLLVRDLEKTRNTHRELAVYEPVSTGYEQDSIRLMLLENEVQQQRLVAEILKRDPNRNLSLNHRVNPSSRLKRFGQILRSKHLNAQQKHQARLINKELMGFQDYRKRYNKS